MKLENPEDFYSLELVNKGNGQLKLNFESEDGNHFYNRIVYPENNISITRDDIEWERGMNDNFVIDSTFTNTVGVYVTTTNLSTIKSQIKKGRELIQKKVKKKFELINENGVKNFSY